MSTLDLSIIRDALLCAEKTCRYHHQDFERCYSNGDNCDYRVSTPDDAREWAEQDARTHSERGGNAAVIRQEVRTYPPGFPIVTAYSPWVEVGDAVCGPPTLPPVAEGQPDSRAETEGGDAS